ncbi:MAG: tetratricopeptide repeat protein [Bacteroidia bacterium]
MKKKLFLLILSISLFAVSNIAQNADNDSLLNLIRQDKQDTLKAKHLIAYARNMAYINPDTAIILCKEALQLVTPVASPEFSNVKAGTEVNAIELIRLKAIGSLGNCYFMKSDFFKALECYTQALKIAEKLNHKKSIAAYSGNLGNVYSLQGNYPKALDYLSKALKINEELNDQGGVATTLLNIGSIYLYLEDYEKSLQYDLKALKLSEKTDNNKVKETVLGNIGIIYRHQGKYEDAMKYNTMAFDVAKADGNKSGMGSQLGSIGEIYTATKDYTNALKYHFKSLALAEEVGDKNEIALNLGFIGELYMLTGDFKKAEDYLKRSHELYKVIGVLDNLAEVQSSLSHLYDTTGRYKEALTHYKEAMRIKNQIYNEKNEKKMVQKEMTLEFEKREALTKSVHEKQLAIAEAEKKRQWIVFWCVIVVLAVSVGFAAVVLRSLRITRKQKEIIEAQKNVVQKQKEIVEKQNEKILDSITYAQSIQQSILIEEDDIRRFLPDSFVFYKPKDIVSGDFYWFSKLDDKIIVAAVDCTGHGVPGAFMSMIGNTLLHQVVNENGVTSVSEILRQLNIGIYNALRQGTNRALSKDGMDIALCCIDYKTKELHFSGAQQPLYIVNDNELIVVNGDRNSVGGGYRLMNSDPMKTNYASHTFSLINNMTIYFFTDGYLDQFGGEHRKKLGLQEFKNLLLRNRHLSMQAQKSALIAAHDAWKGNNAQIDDILVMGIRITV